MSTQIQEIAVKALVPTPDNPRVLREDEAFFSLVASIRSEGVLVPLLARPHPRLDSAFDLRAGHRRLQAAKLAGLATVPVIVRAMDDKTAMEVTVTENLQREDLTPFEESAGVQRLLEVGWELEAIADRLGKPASWVARRAKLRELSAGWQKCVKDPTHVLSVWPANLLEAVARLPDDTQDLLLEQCGNRLREDGRLGNDRRWENAQKGTIPTLAELEKFIDGEVLSTLRAAPFKLDDVLLVPAAAACTSCAKRASAAPLLFPDLETEAKAKSKAAGDRCLDLACFRAKCAAQADRKIAELAAEHGKVVPIALSGLWNAGVENEKALKKKFAHLVDLASYDSAYVPAKAKEKGALPAVVVHSEKDHLIGTTAWVKPRIKNDSNRYGSATLAAGASKTPSAGKPLAAKRKELAARRNAVVVRKVVEQLESWAKVPKGLPSRVITGSVSASLVIAFGTAHRHDYASDAGAGDGWKAFERCEDLPFAIGPEELHRMELKAVIPVLCGRMRIFQTTKCDRQYREAQRIAEVFGIDLEELAAQAVTEIPEPKSWAKAPKAKQKESVAAKKDEAEKTTKPSKGSSRRRQSEPVA